MFQRTGGPCPALAYGVDGKSLCGLVAYPQQFFPVRAFRWGAEALSAGAAILCGAGIGCDACLDSEVHSPAIGAALRAKADKVPRRAVAAAKRAWGLVG